MDSELEESRSEAASLLRNSSHLALFALGEGISVSGARRKLLCHVAGAPDPLGSGAEHRNTCGRLALERLESVRQSDSGVREASSERGSHENHFFICVESKASQGPIIAYIRPPGHADATARPSHSR
jgi:hypothetical protein